MRLSSTQTSFLYPFVCCSEFVEPLGVAHFNVEGTIEVRAVLVYICSSETSSPRGQLFDGLRDEFACWQASHFWVDRPRLPPALPAASLA